jgi:hypothetical protein
MNGTQTTEKETMSSNYENAPATLILATNCAACGRPLVDAASVEAGLGPDCRKKYGAAEIDDDARKAANVIVHRIAVEQTGKSVLEGVAELRALGCDKLADRITKRVRPVEIVDLNNGRAFVLRARHEDFDGFLAAVKRIRGRRWDGGLKGNTFPAASKRAVFELLKVWFPGVTAIGPKGVFVIPTHEEIEAAIERTVAA